MLVTRERYTSNYTRSGGSYGSYSSEPVKRRAPQHSAPKKAREQKAAAKKAAKPAPEVQVAPKKKGGGGKVFARLLVALLAVCAVLVGVDVALSWEKIHPGVTVHGVEVGGLSVSEAAAVLEDDLVPLLEETSVVAYATADDAALDGIELEVLATNPNNESADEDEEVSEDSTITSWELDLATVGASVDCEALAEEAYACGRSVATVYERLFAWLGKVDITPGFTYDDEVYVATTSKINNSIGTKVVEYKLKIKSGSVSVKAGHAGWLISDDEFTTAFEAALLGEVQAFVVPMETVDVHISEETAAALAEEVQATLNEGATFTYKKTAWSVDAATLGSLITQTVLEAGEGLKIEDGSAEVVEAAEASAAYESAAGVDEESGWSLQAYVDFDAVYDYLTGQLGSAVFGNATDASFDVSSGEVVIVESKTGKGPNREQAAQDLQDALFGAGSRDITIEKADVQPEITTEDAEGMGVTEKLASWSIALSGSSARISNITLLCELINGSLIAPGEEWSFNGTTGERTAAKGFQEAPVIVNGKHENQLGGGICQVATCVFNAACYSGLEIISRTNHSFYISAYDDYGFADATVSWESPDLVWANDTENYIYLSAYVSGGYCTVALWGTSDGRTVTCERGSWKSGTKYKTIEEEDDTLEEGKTETEQSGIDGRKITIHYLVEAADGTVIHDTNFVSTYSAQNEIIRVGTKKTKSSKKKKSSSTDSDESESDE